MPIRWRGVDPADPSGAGGAGAGHVALAHLSLLFVPVGIGVVTCRDLVATYGLRLGVAVLLSSLIGLAVSALLLQAPLASLLMPFTARFF